MSEVSFILLSALFLSVPLGIKYLIAFQTRHLLDDLKTREREVELLAAQAEALERQTVVMRRAVDQVGSQHRQVQARREMLEEKISLMQYRTEPLVSRQTPPQALA
jgi:hypothetical protein